MEPVCESLSVGAVLDVVMHSWTPHVMRSPSHCHAAQRAALTRRDPLTTSVHHYYFIEYKIYQIFQMYVTKTPKKE